MDAAVRPSDPDSVARGSGPCGVITKPGGIVFTSTLSSTWSDLSTTTTPTSRHATRTVRPSTSRGLRQGTGVLLGISLCEEKSRPLPQRPVLLFEGVRHMDNDETGRRPDQGERQVRDLAATTVPDHFRVPVGRDPRSGWGPGAVVFAPAPYVPVVIVQGEPRSGKSRGVCAPVLCSWCGSAVVVSVRDDLLTLAGPSRERRGEVRVFDPADLVEGRTHPWNLLGAFRTWAGAIHTTKQLIHAEALIGVQDLTFWRNLAEKLVCPMFFAAANSGLEIADVLRWVKTGEEFEVRSSLAQLSQRPGAEEAIIMFEAVAGYEERTRSSVYATADSVLAVLDDPLAQAALRSDGDDFSDFVATPGNTLFVVAPAVDQRAYAPLLTALIHHIISGAERRHLATRRPMNLMLLVDEAGNVGKIPDLASLSSRAAGSGLQLVTAWHGPSQIRATYGEHEANTILESSPAKLWLPGSSREAAALLDELDDPLAPADPEDGIPAGRGIGRLRRIPRGHAVVVLGHQAPRLVRLLDIDGPDLRITM